MCDPAQEIETTMQSERASAVEAPVDVDALRSALDIAERRLVSTVEDWQAAGRSLALAAQERDAAIRECAAFQRERDEARATAAKEECRIIGRTPTVHPQHGSFEARAAEPVMVFQFDPDWTPAESGSLGRSKRRPDERGTLAQLASRGLVGRDDFDRARVLPVGGRIILTGDDGFKLERVS